jgi:hypothetical protein
MLSVEMRQLIARHRLLLNALFSFGQTTFSLSLLRRRVQGRREVYVCIYLYIEIKYEKTAKSGLCEIIVCLSHLARLQNASFVAPFVLRPTDLILRRFFADSMIDSTCSAHIATT